MDSYHLSVDEISKLASDFKQLGEDSKVLENIAAHIEKSFGHLSRDYHGFPELIDIAAEKLKAQEQEISRLKELITTIQSRGTIQ